MKKNLLGLEAATDSPHLLNHTCLQKATYRNHTNPLGVVAIYPSSCIKMSLSMANKYGGVGMVSAGWVLMAYAQMPFGPTAGMVAPASPGQKNWGNRIFMVRRGKRCAQSINVPTLSRL